jgi:hypothetical protein
LSFPQLLVKQSAVEDGNIEMGIDFQGHYVAIQVEWEIYYIIQIGNQTLHFV